MEENKVFRMLGLATRAGKIAFGNVSVEDTIIKKKAKLVLIAEDSADRTKNNIIRIAEQNKVPYRIYGTIESLSRSIGKDNKAIVSIKDSNFVNEILKLIDGGEIIG